MSPWLPQKLAPIKRLAIPRFKLCGAHLLAKLLEHIKSTLKFPLEDVYAWTDSTIVVNWLDGNPRRFKTYVGNRISFILDRIPPNRWKHVPGKQNPVDCASIGLLPFELMEHDLWWDGPVWLKLPSSDWPKQSEVPLNETSDEQREICLLVGVEINAPFIPMNRFSSFTKLTRVTALVLRFIYNCRICEAGSQDTRITSPLTVEEIVKAENYWLSHSQKDCFASEIAALASNVVLPSDSSLSSLCPFLDSNGILAEFKTVILCNASSYSSWQTLHHETHYTSRAPPSLTCGTYSPHLLTQSQIPHRRWSPISAFRYSWVHHLSQLRETQTPNDGTTPN